MAPICAYSVTQSLRTIASDQGTGTESMGRSSSSSSATAPRFGPDLSEERPKVTEESKGLVPRHPGYDAQPQNWLPAFRPVRAVFRTMPAPHVGQLGPAGTSPPEFIPFEPDISPGKHCRRPPCQPILRGFLHFLQPHREGHLLASWLPEYDTLAPRQVPIRMSASGQTQAPG